MSSFQVLQENKKNAPSTKPEATKNIGVTGTSVSPGAEREEFLRMFDPKPIETLDGGLLRFRAPFGDTFITGPGGVFRVIDKDGQTIEQPICGPLSVINDIENDEGVDQRRLVRWTDDEGRQHQCVFSRADIVSDPKTVIRRLVSEGLNIRHSLNSQGGSQHIQNFLAHYPAQPKMLGVQRLGWVEPGKVFVLPKGLVIGRSAQPVIFTGREDDEPRYSSKGTLEDWQTRIGADALYSKRVAFALCVAVAPTLMIFDGEMENGGFHFFGPSSKGKSTMARALCSVWGSAAEGEKNEMGSWRTTDNRLESVAATHNSLPMVLDEITQVKADHLVDVLYMLGNGLGKGRSRSDMSAAPVLTWRTMFISTGERTTDEHAATARNKQETQDGALIRMANIPAVVSDDLGVFDYLPDGVTAGELADRIGIAAKIESYGTAGPAFVEKLIKEVERIGGAEKFSLHLRERREAWMQAHVVGSDSKVRRAARRFAFVATAGEIAIRLGIFPWKSGEANEAAAACFKAWLGEFKTDAQKIEEICSAVDDYVLQHVEQFHRVPLSGLVIDPSDRQHVGYLIQADNDLSHAFFIPKAFSEGPCASMHKTRREACEALQKAGRLKHNNGFTYKKGKGFPVDPRVPLQTAIIVQNVPYMFGNARL